MLRIPKFPFPSREELSPADIKRFWSRVDRRSEIECWPWIAGKFPAGYGAFKPKTGKHNNLGAHRIAFVLTWGNLTPGQQICHRCDNPPCCNPHHLFEGSAYDNSHDRDVKGRLNSPGGRWRFLDKDGNEKNPPRRFYGTKHCNAVFSEEDVREIWKLHEAGLNYPQIALKFGVHRNTVGRVLTKNGYTEIVV